MKNARIGWALFLTFGLAVCATSEPINTSQSAVDKVKTITFLDSKTFDKKLSAALGDKESTVKVTFPVPFTTNDIPERIDKWLVAIEDNGGKVDVTPEQIERGLFSELVSLARKIYKEYKEKQLYKPAKNYNANVYYEPRTGNVTRVLFNKKTFKGRK